MRMWKLVAIVAALLGLPSACFGAFTIFQTYIPPAFPQITCNIVTGVATGASSPCVSPAANCNGSADAAPVFMAFNTWARTNQGSNQVVLTIPAGSTCFFNSSQASPLGLTSANSWAAGINNLIVEGAGATITSVGGIGFSLGANGINCNRGLTDANGCSARIQSVSGGASSITLTSASYSAGYLSRFSVNKWIMVGGLNVQSIFLVPQGNPVNMHYFERRQITAINSGTGEITLDRPLTNSYSSDWPQFTPGDGFEQDQGGPATIYLLNDGWNATVEYRGLTISQSGPTYAGVRNATFRDVMFTGGDGGIPSQNDAWTYINTTSASALMEVDKLIGTITFDGGSINQVQIQSSSVDRLIMRNGATVTNRLDGGAKYNELTDAVINNLGPGVQSYGSYGTSDQTICTRCNIGTLNYTLGYSNTETPPFWTKASGVITMPLAAAQGSGPGQRFFAPNSRIFYNATNTNPPINFSCCETIGSFQVGTITSDPWPALDNQSVTTTVNITSATKNLNVPSGPFVSGDVGKTIVVGGAGSGGGTLRTWITGFTSATDVTLYNAASTTVGSSQTVQWGTSNMYIQTNQSGGFPSVSAISTNAIQLKTAGSWNFTCDACTGDANAVGTNIQNGAPTGAPLGSYITRTYSPPTTQGGLGVLSGRGVFSSLRVNVTAAASIGASNMTLTMGQFVWFVIDQSTPSAPVARNWQPSDLSINLKQAGIRLITPSGVTCDTGGGPVAGGCSGDTINLPSYISALWVQQGVGGPFINTNAGGSGTGPTFTMTLQTNPVQ